MHLQTLRSFGTGWDSIPAQVCASGDVTIHPNAAIAPGVILQAAPNSRILIAEGVCIGIGAVLNAYDGTIEIENGATLGAGVLMVGCGKIGSRACVGAATTIFNHSIAPWQVVPAASLIGDSSRHPENPSETNAATSSHESTPDSNVEAPPLESEEKGDAMPASTEVTEPNPVETEVPPGLEEEAVPAETPSESVASDEKPEPIDQVEEETPVYGQVYVNRILFTIFPQGRSPNSSS